MLWLVEHFLKFISFFCIIFGICCKLITTGGKISDKEIEDIVRRFYAKYNKRR